MVQGVNRRREFSQVLTVCIFLGGSFLSVGCALRNPIQGQSGGTDGTGFSEIEEAYKSQLFISGWGHSKISQRDADLDAKRNVSEQILSNLESETETIASAVMVGGEITDYQKLYSSVRSATAFNKAELIHIDAASHGYSSNNRYVAFAFLERKAAANSLKEDYEMIAEGFRLHAKMASGSQDDPRGFSAALRAAYSAFTEMASLASQYQAVAGCRPSSWQGDKLLFSQLEECRVEFLANASVAVSLSNYEGFDSSALSKAIVDALIDLGVRSQTGDCAPGFHFLLKMTPVVSWGELLGQRFMSVKLVGAVAWCKDQKEIVPVVISGSELEGTGNDPGNSFDRAVSSGVMGPLIKSALSSVFPFVEK